MTAGGSAMFHGANYQTAVGAFFAALGLAENTNRLPPEVPQGTPPTRVGAEQGWPVDDLTVWFGSGAMAWIQAKATLDASGLSDVLLQVVRHVVNGREQGSDTPLEPDDKVVIALGHASRWITEDLRNVLNRLGGLLPGDPLEMAFQNQEPLRDAYNKAATRVRAALEAEGQPADDDTVRHVLSSTRVWHVTEEQLRTNTLSLLDPQVLETGDQGNAAVALLAQQLSEAAQNRTAHGVRELRTLLVRSGIPLRAPPSVASDATILVSRTTQTIEAEQIGRVLRTADGEVHISRSATQELLRAIRVGSISVTGRAGSGKSCVLLDAAVELRTAGERVVFLDATDPAMMDPQRALGLTLRLDDVLEIWDDPTQVSYLFIDGFDTTRLRASLSSLVRLIRNLKIRNANWHVAIAIREYDLLYSPDLRDLLPYSEYQGIPAQLRDVERFGKVAHIFVRDLDPAEVANIGERSPALQLLVASAPANVQALLLNPFNLSIAASLSLGPGSIADLSGVQTRTDLMDLWWERRVRNGATGLEKERLLETIANAMIAERKLRLSADHLRGGEAATELLSDGVIVARGNRGREIAFGHAIVFDHVVASTTLQAVGSIATVLGSDRDAFLFILPSIRIRLAELWQTDYNAFYRELEMLFAEGSQRLTLLLVAAALLAKHVQQASELAQVLDRHDDASRRIIKFLVRVLIYERERGRAIIGDNGQPWAAVALEMAQRLPRHEHDTLLLLHELTQVPGATPSQLSAIADSARLALQRQLDATEHNPRLMRLAIESFMRSYDSDPAAGEPLLSQILTPSRIQRVGHYELEPLAYSADRLRDANALESIYSGIFANVSVPSGQIPIGSSSAIIGLVQDASQTLSMARWALAQRFAAFLADEPEAAVRAFCRVIDRRAGESHHVSEITVSFHGAKLNLMLDAGNVWDSTTYEHDDWYTMSKAFETRLQNGLAVGDDFFDVALNEIAQHGHALFLWRILIRNAGKSAASSLALSSFLAQRSVLLSLELGEPIGSYLAEGYPKLPHEAKAAIDAAILSVLDDESNVDLRPYRERRVEELVASIPHDAIVTERVAAIHAATPPSTPYERTMTLSGRFEHGASITMPRMSELAAEDGASADLIEVIDAAQPVIQSALQGTAAPSREQILSLMRRANEVSGSLESRLRTHAIDIIAALAWIGLQRDLLGADDSTELLPLLLEAVQTEGLPTLDDEGETQPDSTNLASPVWDSLNPLANGIQALGRLYRYVQEERIVEELTRLTRHQDPSIRFLAVHQSGEFRDVNPGLVWEISERAAADESIVVVSAGITAANMVAHLDFERLRRLMFALYDRFVPAALNDDVARSILNWVVERAKLGDAEALARINPILSQPWERAEAARKVILQLANGIASTAHFEDRRRSATMLAALVNQLNEHTDELALRHGFNLGAYPETDREAVTESIRLLSDAAERLFHASERHTRTQAGSGSQASIDVELFDLEQPILESLARLKYSRSSYYVVKALLNAIPLDPRGVLVLGATAIRNGVQGGLALDGMAEDDIREFVVRYVDGYRDLLESDRECLGLVIDVVDTFVDAGWPRWIDVVFKLDSIYRDE